MQSLQIVPLILKPVLSLVLRLIREYGMQNKQQHSPVLVNNFPNFHIFRDKIITVNLIKLFDRKILFTKHIGQQYAQQQSFEL